MVNESTEIIVPNIGTIQIPENRFEAIMYLNEVKSNLTDLVTIIEKDVQSRIDHLMAENITEDDMYKIVPVFATRKTSTLDESKFKEEMPDAYKNSLTIKATEAEKIIGKENLRDLIIESYGWDIFEQNANCTLTEARKNIPKAMQESYITEAYQQTGVDVVKK